ncbi:MAG: hypothetical protein E6J47_08995 [Chloroflexi bacterium]|nr:MAG: hypothetical protein E6J47_08995 [Chloroflexota bacterium]
MDDPRFRRSGWSRRNFLETVGAGVPTLRLMLEGANPAAQPQGRGFSREKFVPIDLAGHFNSSPADFGPQERAQWLGGDSARDSLLRTPAGEHDFYGLPFRLGPDGTETKRWLAWTASRVEIRLQERAGFLCLAGFCDWDKNERPEPGDDVAEQVGQLLAEATLVYEDGSSRSLAIRRRFEVGAPSYPWGHLSFASRPHRRDAPRRLTDPLTSGTDWGELQTAVADNAYGGGPLGTLWVSALRNPEPEKTVRELRIEARAEAVFFLCGLTLFRGRESPLRYERLRLYRITLPEAAAEEVGRFTADVDLGIVARTWVPRRFEPEAWLRAPEAGLGERSEPIAGGRHLYAEVTASPEATLVLADTKTGRRYAFELGRVVPGEELEGQPAGARVEVLEREKAWVQGRVLDAATRQPTPVRLAFRSKEGRYIPPYGHRTEINDSWFEDYGADVKLMDSSFAYVDGTFQVELPAGEVYVEITKGFEYAPVRRKLEIEPGRRELTLEVSRLTDLRARGWVTADTQAEGLNLISLLAAQWGDLFTNVGDLAHGPIVSRDGETIVQVSTENRQHILGHLGLVGGQGAPVFPMSASGPSESYLGDPLRTSLADWADAQRKRGGLVVAVHFPYPTAELAADVALGKIDAVELYPHGEHFNTLRFLDWYRYLNCGYRLPAVGGTDKMGAYMAVGANRTYAYLGQAEFNFANWAEAVRKGNTFMTTGPLVLFQADGHPPGDEITLGAGGGTVEARVEAKSFVPFHRLEVVLNGKVVASREDAAGTREMILAEKVRVPGPGWLAARCASKLGPTTAWSLGIQAHTSPVYLRVPGQELFSAPAVAYMLTLIEGAETWAEGLATRPDAESLARVRKVFAEARERLHRRLHEHGIAH